ncbi:MAG: PepSY domain-containing protein [Nitrospiraceae bacterium]
MKSTLWILAGLSGALLMAGGCAHDSKKELIRSTNISLIDAVRTAEASVSDGKAVEAELEKEEGRAMYEVELIDAKKEIRKVYVDAGSGKVFKIH